MSSTLPTRCGLATFTEALGLALEAHGSEVGVVRVLDAPEVSEGSELAQVGTLVANQPGSVDRAARALNQFDVVVVQHEYGLFGGPDGDDVVAVLDLLTVPVISILHTVLLNPTAHQFEVLNEVIERSDAVVVMTAAAQRMLRGVYVVNDHTVSLIAHGATVFNSPGGAVHDARPTFLTWGLIGPGKGIERVIDALATLKDLNPRPRYVVAGRTHPKVLAQFGDRYRDALRQRVTELGVEDMVIFDDSYRSLASLGTLIESADAIILPYDSYDQATSGVLVDAVAAGRPVIATAFPHAIELLGSGAGMVVDHGDVEALSDAMRTLSVDRGVRDALAAEARRVAPSLAWSHVAEQYLALVDRVLERARVRV